MRRLIALGCAVIALALAGCGGSDGGGSSDSIPADATSPPPQSEFVPPSAGGKAFPPDFVRCMAGKGVDVETSPEPMSEPGFFQCLPFLHG